MNSIKAKKGIRIICVTFLVYGALVATHQGEFWPFSIYPMFSNAGQPWTRALVLDISETSADELWNRRSLNKLYGKPVSIKEFGVDQIDFSNFVSKTEAWTPQRIHAMYTMFENDNLADRSIMVLRASGSFVTQDSVAVNLTPLFIITADTIMQNPNMDFSQY